MAILGDLMAKLRLDTKEFDSGLRKASGSTKAFANDSAAQINRINNGFGKLTTAIKGVAIAAAAMKGFEAIYNAMDRLDQLGDTAAKIGITAERLQELRYAAERLGSSTETMDAALTKFGVGIGQAQKGTGKLKDILDEYGISLMNANGTLKSSEQLFNEFGNKLGEVTDKNRQLADATEAFGRQAGPEMAMLLADGTKAIDEQTAAARNLGLIYSEDVVAGAGDAKNKLDDLKKFIEVELTTAIASNATTIGQWAQTAIAWISKVIEGYGMLGKVWREKDRDMKVDWVNMQEVEINKLKNKKPTLFRDGMSIQTEIDERRASQAAAQAVLDRYNAEDKAMRELKNAPAIPTPAAVTGNGGSSGSSIVGGSAGKAPKATPYVNPFYGKELSLGDYAPTIDVGEIAKPADIMLESYENAFDQIINSSESATSRMLKDWSDTTTQLDFATMSWIGQSADALTEFVTSGKADFGDLIRIQMQEMLVKAFSMIGGAMFGGSVGLSSSQLSGAYAQINALPGPRMAGGGSIGGPTLVGERGPELFIPNSPGRIVNNHAMRQMGSGGSVRVEIVNKGTPQQATSQETRFDPRGMVIQVITEDLRRNGPIASGMSQLYGLRRNT
jgi:hypothetical protein